MLEIKELMRKRPKARRFNAKIINIFDEAKDVKTFRLESPKDWYFLPGQFVMIWFRDKFGKENRAYSISSSPLSAINNGFFDLTIKLYGKFTHHLWTLKHGDIIEVGGPYGKFVLDIDSNAPYVGIAGGVGITPIMSMIRFLIETNSKRKILLFYSNRLPDEITFKEELDRYNKELDNFKVIYTLTRLPKEMKHLWNGLTGRFNAEIFKREIEEFIGKEEEPEFYICGTIQMIMSFNQMLVDMGFSEEKIKYEKFW